MAGRLMVHPQVLLLKRQAQTLLPQKKERLQSFLLLFPADVCKSTVTLTSWSLLPLESKILHHSVPAVTASSEGGDIKVNRAAAVFLWSRTG